MTTTIPIPSPAHLLRTLPALLGCLPRESLVLVPLREGRSCGALRIDLPRPEEIAQVASTAVGSLCHLPDVDAAVVVVLTDAPARDGAGLAHDPLVAAVSDRLGSCGIEVRDELLVAGDAWCRYAEGDERPLDEIAPDRDEHLADRDQHAGADLPEGHPGRRVEVRAALDAFSRTASALLRLDDDAVLGEPVVCGSREVDPHAAARLAASDADLPALFEAALEWGPDLVDPYDVALLLTRWRSASLRDVALAQWAGDLAEGRRALAFQERWADGDRRLPEGPVRLLGEGPRPDPRRLRRARDLVRAVAALAPDAHLAGCLAMCAWLSWALGSSTHAAHYAALALDREPGHGLADIVRRLVDAARLPQWAYDEFGATLDRAGIPAEGSTPAVTPAAPVT